MKNLSLMIAFLFLFIACQKEKVDIIVINSNTYTVNDSFEFVSSFAVKNGKFVAVGSNE